MSQSLDAKQYVPLSADEQQTLRDQAAVRGISPGLLARALLTHAMDNLDNAVEARIDAEKLASKERITTGARAAVNARWSTQKTKGSTP